MAFERDVESADEPPVDPGLAAGPRPSRVQDATAVSAVVLAGAPLPTGPDGRFGPDGAPLDRSITAALPTPAGGFPDPTDGPLLVLYQCDNGRLGLRWRLDPVALAATRGAFGADAGATLVARLRRVNNPEAVATLPLGETAADGEREASVPAGSGDLQAEIGYAGSHGGWLLVARSNALDLIAPVGVAFLRGSGEQPAVATHPTAVNARIGFGWAATIGADARARKAPDQVATADALSALALTPRPGVFPAAPPGGSPAVAADAAGASASAPLSMGPGASPLTGPFPLWRLGAAPSGWQGTFAPPDADDALTGTPDTVSAARTVAAGLASARDGDQPAPGVSADTDRPPRTGAAVGLPAGARHTAPPGSSAPPESPEPSPAGPRVGLPRVAPVPDPAPSTPPLPTRGLRLSLREPPPGASTGPAIADSGNHREPGAKGAGTLTDPPGHPHPSAPVSGSGPVIRPGADTATTLHAELVVYGSAAAGSLVDLGGHTYRVGPGGRFVLRVPVTDQDLIASLLAQLPALPVTARDDTPPPAGDNLDGV